MTAFRAVATGQENQALSLGPSNWTGSPKVIGVIILAYHKIYM